MASNPRALVSDHLAVLAAGGTPYLPLLHTRPDVYADIHDDLWVEWAVSELVDQWNAEETA